MQRHCYVAMGIAVAVRELVSRVTIIPVENGRPTIEVTGRLTALIGAEVPPISVGISLVAEEGFEPPTHGL